MSNKLYIIGNGFDIAHDLPTTYENYFYWLEQIGHKDFARLLESNFPLERRRHLFPIWQNYEKALGEYNLEEIFEYITDGLIDNEPQNARNAVLSDEHPMRKQFQLEDAPDIVSLTTNCTTNSRAFR